MLATPPVTIVAGKGGVGKTTVTAAMALAASRAGLNVLIVEVDGKSGLSSLFGHPGLDYDDAVLLAGGAGNGEVRARTLTPDTALVEYLEDHGLKRISNRLAQTGALDMVATATPGIKDVLVLGKVKQLERSGAADLILIDAPAAGHAITFLRSARGLLDAVRVGPIETQAQDVLDLITDPARCQVMLVTLPEETPVNEVIETAFSLEDQVGVALGPVVVNGTYPQRPGLDVPTTAAADRAGVTLERTLAGELRHAVQFYEGRRALQVEQLERLAKELPLTQLILPFLFTADMGIDHIGVLADHLTDGLRAVAVRP